MYIDGKYYSGEEFTYLHWGAQPHGYSETQNGFRLYIMRSVQTNDGNIVSISIFLDENGSIESGKKYFLQPNGKPTHHTFIDYYVNDDYFRYVATEGWIRFSSLGNGQMPYRLSGEFEFTAVEQNSGEVMKVTDGKFDNLRT